MAARRKSKKKVRDEALANIDDGCDAWLVQGARFDGVLEIPVIERPEKIVIPSAFVPFSKRGKVDSPARFAVCEFELDREFAPLLKDPAAYVKELRKFQAFVTPDSSLYWDMPLASQVANKYRNHAVGAYMQRQGIYTIPNVRWGDERTYTCGFLPEPGDVAFDLALDALSAFVPGGPAATRSLSLAAKAGRGSERASGAVGKLACTTTNLGKGKSAALSSRGVRLGRAETAVVYSNLNNMHHSRLKGRNRARIPIGEYIYTVGIRDFGDYTIIARESIE